MAKLVKAAFLATISCEPIEAKLRRAVKEGALVPCSGVDTAALASDKGLLELEQWRRKQALRRRVIQLDDFPQGFARAESARRLFAEAPMTAREP